MRPHLTTRELTSRWFVSAKTLERWRHDGTGPTYIKVGKKVLYPVVQVERFEKERLCDPIVRDATSRSAA